MADISLFHLLGKVREQNFKYWKDTKPIQMQDQSLCEILVSYDVRSLFPSVAIPEPLKYLTDL